VSEREHRWDASCRNLGSPFVNFPAKINYILILLAFQSLQPLRSTGLCIQIRGRHSFKT